MTFETSPAPWQLQSLQLVHWQPSLFFRNTLQDHDSTSLLSISATMHASSSALPKVCQLCNTSFHCKKGPFRIYCVLGQHQDGRWGEGEEEEFIINDTVHLNMGFLQSFNPSVNNFPDTDKILAAGTKFNEFPEFGASRGNIKCLSTLLLWINYWGVKGFVSR